MHEHAAASYWVDTALGYFETMVSKQSSMPSQDDDVFNAKTAALSQIRSRLPPLKPSKEIVLAIAACVKDPQLGRVGVHATQLT